MATTGHLESTQSSATPRLRNPLNVVVEKVGATRAMVHGDVSVESLKELLMSSMSLLPTTEEPDVHDEGLKKSGALDRKLKLENQKSGEENGEEESDPALKNIKKERLSLISGSAKESFDKNKDKKSKGVDDEDKGQEKLLDQKFFAKSKTKSKKTISGTKAKGRKPKFEEEDGEEEEEQDQEQEEEEEEKDTRESLPSCLSIFSTEESPFSNNGRWLRRHFGKPLVQGLKDVVKKNPQDPVGYLAFWLRKYRSEEEVRQRRKEFDCELEEKRLLITSHAPDREEPLAILEPEYSYGDYEEGGGNADSNFKNYYPSDVGTEVAAEVAM